jgi:hypothetical protein
MPNNCKNLNPPNFSLPSTFKQFSGLLCKRPCIFFLFFILFIPRNGTPTKRQVSKRQVSKSPVSNRLKRRVYKTSGLQNVRFTKCQVYKTSGLQKVRLQKKPSINILYLWLVEIRRLCCSHVCRQSDGCVLFSIFEVSLSHITIMASNK